MNKQGDKVQNGKQTVKLKGKDYGITLPGFAEREDICVGYQEEAENQRRQQRALFGALGLCVPELGGGLEAYENAQLDLVIYGGRVYSSLMSQGHDRQELAEAAVQCFQIACQSLFPREAEVSKTEHFTEPAEGAPI